MSSRNLSVKVTALSEIDWEHVLSQGESYLYSLESLSAYQNLDLLTVSLEQDLLALWPIPYTWEHERKIARREVRLLPYHPPLIFKGHLVDKRRILSSFLSYMKENYYAIDLPLAPHFHHLALFWAAGIYVEWRNTHHFSLSHMLTDHIHPKVKNHIRSAKKKVTLEWEHAFDFERGIITDNPSHRTVRRNLALNLLKSGKGRVLTAFNGTKVEGQAVVVHDYHTAYLFHSWFEKQNTRGVPSHLIETISNWALKELSLYYFDLEGSVIPSVDRFFANFGGLQTPYAYIQWCRDRQEMLKRIEETLLLFLRFQENEKKIDKNKK